MSTARNRLEPAARYRIVRATPRERTLSIRWGDGHESEFHHVWLRHPLFYPANSGADPSDETLRVPEAPGSVSVRHMESGANGVLRIDWSDGAQTTHQAGWLREHCYSDRARAERKHRPVLWDAASAARLPWFDYRALGEEAAIFELLRAVRDYGFARLRGVPTVPGTIERVAALFGPVRETNYGRLFDVRTDSRIQIGANTAKFLAPHTDENYRHAPPGISLFHCLEAHVDGEGRSTLTDGFLAAKRLAERDPEAFELLARVPLGFRNTDMHEEDIRANARVVCCDIDGEVVGIRYTDRTFPPLDLPAQLVEPVYGALRAFAQELYAPELTLRYLLGPGELHVFDNQRVLHGRTGFDPSRGVRHLQQCSVERDEFHNRLRLLARKVRPEEADLVLAGGALG